MPPTKIVNPEVLSKCQRIFRENYSSSAGKSLEKHLSTDILSQHWSEKLSQKIASSMPHTEGKQKMYKLRKFQGPNPILLSYSVVWETRKGTVTSPSRRTLESLP